MELLKFSVDWCVQCLFVKFCFQRLTPSNCSSSFKVEVSSASWWLTSNRWIPLCHHTFLAITGQHLELNWANMNFRNPQWRRWVWTHSSNVGYFKPAAICSDSTRPVLVHVEGLFTAGASVSLQIFTCWFVCVTPGGHWAWVNLF